jgi:hypothetical protein
MTSDFAREFYDLIPPSLGPHSSKSQSFDAMNPAISSRNHVLQANPLVTQPFVQHDYPSTVLSPKALSKMASDVCASSLLSASKKASAARQRYVGLARSPHSSRNRFDLGLDSPGTPPLPQPPNHSHTPSVSSYISAMASVKPSSPDGSHTRSRSRLVELDSRLLQVRTVCHDWRLYTFSKVSLSA